MTSAFIAALRSLHFRDVQFLTIRVGNCSAQNMNWTIIDVNSRLSVTEITLALRRGTHSCRATAFSVEQNMKDVKNVYDFEDFKNVVASKGNYAVLEDFIDFPNGSSESRQCSAKPKLRGVKIVQFRSGHTNIFSI